MLTWIRNFSLKKLPILAVILPLILICTWSLFLRYVPVMRFGGDKFPGIFCWHKWQVWLRGALAVPGARKIFAVFWWLIHWLLPIGRKDHGNDICFSLSGYTISREQFNESGELLIVNKCGRIVVFKHDYEVNLRYSVIFEPYQMCGHYFESTYFFNRVKNERQPYRSVRNRSPFLVWFHKPSKKTRFFYPRHGRISGGNADAHPIAASRS